MASYNRGAGPPASGSGQLFEWRTYVPLPGQATALVLGLRRSQEAIAAAGLNPLGLWVEELGSPGLVCSLWSFATLEARNLALAAGAHPDQAGNVAVLDHVESSLCRPPLSAFSRSGRFIVTR